MPSEIRATPPPLRDARLVTMVPTGHKRLPPSTVFDDREFQSRDDESDPPFRAPASWSKPEDPPSPRRQWYWSERSTAAFLGFAAGILIIVPTVMFLSAAPDRLTALRHERNSVPAHSDIATPTTDPLPNLVETANVAAIGGSGWFDTKPAAIVPTSDAHPKASDAAASQDAEQRAKEALSNGRVTEARDLLRQTASPEAPRLWFVLAETYDPRQTSNAPLGANSIDNLKAANINFARYYYQRALTYGIDEARARLDALDPEALSQPTLKKH